MSKILITGATGFIGSHLLKRLIKEHEVCAIVRENSDLWRIKGIDVLTMEADIESTRDVLSIFKKFNPKIVIHLATYYEKNHEPFDITPMINTNVLGIANLLEASKEFGVKLFINTSTCFVYEAYGCRIKEDYNLEPLNLYALTKIQSEELCNFYANNNMKIITFRLFPPYGTMDKKLKLIPYIIGSALRDYPITLNNPNQMWDFIHVRDIVESYVKVLDYNPINNNKIFNIGSGIAVSIGDIVKKIEELTDKKINVTWNNKKPDIGFLCADITKARKNLKWSPKYNILKTGLEDVIQYERSSNKEIK